MRCGRVRDLWVGRRRSPPGSVRVRPPGLPANRARPDRTAARMKTYGVARASTAPMVSPTRPMITSENSPHDQGSPGAHLALEPTTVPAGGIGAGHHLGQGGHHRQGSRAAGSIGDQLLMSAAWPIATKNTADGSRSGVSRVRAAARSPRQGQSHREGAHGGGRRGCAPASAATIRVRGQIRSSSSSPSSGARSAGPRGGPTGRDATNVTASAMTATVTPITPCHHCRPGGEHRQQRQVDGHREILEHQHRQHGRRFAVAQPAQIRQQPGTPRRTTRCR